MKSNEKSNQLRTEGNKLYSDKKFFQALLKYNESLCFAETGTENLGLAFANKSAVYFEAKIFDKCLENIKLAKENFYPEKNFEILNKREEKCKELERSQVKKDPWNFFKLSYPANKRIPYIADCLELRNDEKYGRHIITNKPLKVGDIVSIEKPFCRILLNESKTRQIPEKNIYQRCANCLKENALDLIPCKTCCYAMFCSKSCESRAFRRYHKFECPVMAYLQKSGSVHMSIRIFFIALSIFAESIEKLEAFIEEIKSEKLTIFDVDVKTEENEKEKKFLQALLSLARSSKSFPLHLHEEILKNHPFIGKIWEKYSSFIKDFLLHCCQISDLNFHGIFSGSSQKCLDQNPVNMFNSLQQAIGSGSLLFTSMLNHSCTNNVLRVCLEGQIALVVCRPITKGSQLFDCYKVNFMKQQKPDRQFKLFNDFGFKCDCEACTKNFPTPPALTFKDVKLLKFAKKADEEIFSMQPGQAMKKYRDCCDILEKNHLSYPCVELCLMQKFIASFLLYQAQPSVLFS